MDLWKRKAAHCNGRPQLFNQQKDQVNDTKIKKEILQEAQGADG